MSLKNKIPFILLFVVSFALYSLTLAPSVVTLFDDSLEFQLVTYQLGIAHPTGYPLYTLLGKLFTFIPIGNVAFRVNLMSAFFAALTIAWLYQIQAHEAEPKIWPGLAALLLAFSPIFWQQATIAEVYSLNSFFVLLILGAALQLKPDSPDLTLRYTAILFGLSLTHHRTTVLFLPALAVYFLLIPTSRAALKKPSLWFELFIMAVFPLSLYLYLPLRGHVGSLDGTYQNTWAGFWQQVTASGYSSTFLWANPFNENRPMGFYGALLYHQFGLFTGLGFVGGSYLLWQRYHAQFALTSIALITYTIFNISYHVTDIEVFFIPVFLLWAGWIGLGLQAIGQGLQRLKSPVMSTSVTIILIGLIGTQITYSIQTTLPFLQSRNTWQIHDYGLDILQQPLPSQAHVVGIVGEITLIRYFQQTVGLRPDLQPRAADQEDLRWATLETALTQHPTAYLTQHAALLPGLPQRWSLSAMGPLVQVQTHPLYQLPPQALNQPVTPALNFVSYQVSRLPHTGAGLAPVRLTVQWQATQPITVNLQISARLLNDTGEVMAVMDTIPVHFAYPTTAWRVGEVVTDVYDLQITAPGNYTPLLIWYDPANNAAEVGRVILAPEVIGF